jgi:hypothetical protein
MADRFSIFRKIVLLFDRSAARKAESEARQSVDNVDKGFNKLGTTIKNLAKAAIGLFAFGKVIDFFRASTEAANRLDDANRRLAATAKIAGINLGFLQKTTQDASNAFKLSHATAAEFTIEVSKLTAKAGQIEKTGDALGAFLDLGAARGLDATRTLKAVQQSILGIDEGTDKLFGKNPSVLYKEFADSIGLLPGALTDAQKAQAILTAALEDGGKVRGEYLKWLSSTKGQQFLAAQSVDKLQETFGKLLQPALAAILPLATRFINWVTRMILLFPVLSARMELWSEQAGTAIQMFFVNVARKIGEFILAIRNGGGVIASWFGFDTTMADSNAITRWADRVEANAIARIDKLKARLEKARQGLDVFDANVEGALLTDTVTPAADNKAAEDAAKKRRQLLIEAAELRKLSKAEEDEILALERSIIDELNRGNLSLERRVELAKELQKVTRAANIVRADRADIPTPTPTLARPSITPFTPGDILARQAAKSDQLRQHELDKNEAYWDEIANQAERAAQRWSNAFEGLFQAMMDGSRGVGAYIIGQLLQGFAQYLEVKAAAAFAEGIWPPNPALIAKGIALSAAAGLARALEGQIGRGGGGGSRASIPASTGSTAIPSTGAAEPRSEINIHFVGKGWPAHDVDFQRAVGSAVEIIRETHGEGFQYIIHPSRSR